MLWAGLAIALASYALCFILISLMVLRSYKKAAQAHMTGRTLTGMKHLRRGDQLVRIARKAFPAGNRYWRDF